MMRHDERDQKRKAEVELLVTAFQASLRASRKAKGLTQKQLAKKLGASDHAVSDWESKVGCGPNLRSFLALCFALQVSPNELLKWKNDADAT